MAKDGESLPDQKVCQILKWMPMESETNYSWTTHFLSKTELIFTVCNSCIPNEFRQKREYKCNEPQAGKDICMKDAASDCLCKDRASFS